MLAAVAAAAIVAQALFVGSRQSQRQTRADVHSVASNQPLCEKQNRVTPAVPLPASEVFTGARLGHVQRVRNSALGATVGATSLRARLLWTGQREKSQSLLAAPEDEWTATQLRFGDSTAQRDVEGEDGEDCSGIYFPCEKDVLMMLSGHFVRAREREIFSVCQKNKIPFWRKERVPDEITQVFGDKKNPCSALPWSITHCHRSFFVFFCFFVQSKLKPLFLVVNVFPNKMFLFVQ